MILPAKIKLTIHISFVSILINWFYAHDAHAGVNEYRLGHNYTNRKVQCTIFGLLGFGMCITFLFYNKKPKIIENKTDIVFQQIAKQPILDTCNIINQNNSELNTETIFFAAYFNKKTIAFIKLLLQKPPLTNPLVDNPLCMVDGLEILNEYEAQDPIIIDACLKQIIAYANEKHCQSITMQDINKQMNETKMSLIKKTFEKYTFLITNQNDCNTIIYKKQLIDIPIKKNRLST